MHSASKFILYKNWKKNKKQINKFNINNNNNNQKRWIYNWEISNILFILSNICYLLLYKTIFDTKHNSAFMPTNLMPTHTHAIYTYTIQRSVKTSQWKYLNLISKWCVHMQNWFSEKQKPFLDVTEFRCSYRSLQISSHSETFLFQLKKNQPGIGQFPISWLIFFYSS